MLDDLKYIHEKDTQDALGAAEKQWEQLQQVYDLPELSLAIDNIVYAGMGGSAVAAQMSASWPGYNLPFEIVRGYDIPVYVSDRTLFVASSYTGDTEETLEALSQAESKGAQIVVMASGGKLAEIAKNKNYPFAQLPTGYHPRHVVLYMFKALLTVLERAGLKVQEEKELKAALLLVKDATAQWRPEVPAARNPAKALALELIGKTPVIYAGPKLFPAACEWKISLNQNARNIAWCGELPEFTHNEFMGWSSHPVDKPYAVIELRSFLEHARVQKQFEVSNRLLSGQWPEPHVINVEGQTVLGQLLWAIALGDFVSLYVAFLNGLNPIDTGPKSIYEKLIKELG